MSDGWVKLHRSIMDHWISDNDKYFSAWLKLIMICNHKENKVLIKGKLYECKRGQSVRSLSSWCEILGPNWTMRNIRTFFKLLEADEMIILETDSKTTKLSICNYDTYNDARQAPDTPPTNGGQAPDNKQEGKEPDDKSSGYKYKLTFNYETGDFNEGIPSAWMTAWVDLYPAVNLEEEIRKAKAWLFKNHRQKKKDFKRFLGGWFSRVQEAGGSRRVPDNPMKFGEQDDYDMSKLYKKGFQ